MRKVFWPEQSVDVLGYCVAGLLILMALSVVIMAFRVPSNGPLEANCEAVYADDPDVLGQIKQLAACCCPCECGECKCRKDAP